MARTIQEQFLYIVKYQCHSMKPPVALQQIATPRDLDGVDLVAESRAILAQEFKRDTDEIEILGIRGVTDRSKVWPAPVPVVVDPTAGAETIGQGEGIAELESPAWTPATPPPAAFPTVEEAGVLTKSDMFKLAERLELEIVKNPDAKFPAVRAAVLAELSARQASAPAA